MAVVTELSSSGNTAAKRDTRACDILFFCDSLSRMWDLNFVTEMSPWNTETPLFLEFNPCFNRQLPTCIRFQSLPVVLDFAEDQVYGNISLFLLVRTFTNVRVRQSGSTSPFQYLYCLALNTKAPYSFNMSVTFHRSTWCNTSQDLNIYINQYLYTTVKHPHPQFPPSRTDYTYAEHFQIFQDFAPSSGKL